MARAWSIAKTGVIRPKRRPKNSCLCTCLSIRHAHWCTRLPSITRPLPKDYGSRGGRGAEEPRGRKKGYAPLSAAFLVRASCARNAYSPITLATSKRHRKTVTVHLWEYGEKVTAEQRHGVRPRWDSAAVSPATIELSLDTGSGSVLTA